MKSKYFNLNVIQASRSIVAKYHDLEYSRRLVFNRSMSSIVIRQI